MKIRTSAWALAGLCLLSCDAPAPEEVGYIILDDEAREAGYAVEIGGELHDGPLPFTAYTDEPAWLVGPDTRRPLDLTAESVLWLRGAKAQGASLPLGHAALADRLWIHGGREAAYALAEQIGGDPEQVDGQWAVTGMDAVYLSSLVQAPEGLTGVSPIAPQGLGHRVIVPRDDAMATRNQRVDALAAYDPFGGLQPARTATAMDRKLAKRRRPVEITPISDAEQPASWFGEYLDERTGARLILDLAGRFSLCTGDEGDREVIRGRYTEGDEAGDLHLLPEEGGLIPTTLTHFEDHTVIEAPELRLHLAMEVN